MLRKQEKEVRRQAQILTMESLVPEDHILRLIDEAIDFSFIYELVEDKYCLDNGRPSIDPVTLIKLPVIQYVCGIRSMRQTIKDCEVNIAYRWFLGIDFNESIPHFTTFGKNYTRRFKDTDLFEQIFMRILEQCVKAGYVDKSTLFVDGTHIKARANSKKSIKSKVKKAARHYEAQLQEEIEKDRIAHGKKPLKSKEEDNSDQDDQSDNTNDVSINKDQEENTENTENTEKSTESDKETKEIKQSTTDPDSGWFHKGEHKSVFAYTIQTACDKNGWITAYDLNPGNMHDSTAFFQLYEKIKTDELKTIVADAGYKIPAIAKTLIDDGITPNFPYKRPMTKKEFFRKHEYVYDEYYDCYICPNDQILKYSTTNRDGYREYKSDPNICAHCPYLKQCTQSKNHTKVIMRHIWEEYMEQCEDIRHTKGRKDEYNKRKETIERIFGTAKEYHGMRYTQFIGKARVAMQVGLTFACMNMKKLAKMIYRDKQKSFRFFDFIWNYRLIPEFCA